MANIEKLLTGVKKLVRERHDESKILGNLLEALTEVSGLDAESSRAGERLADIVAQSDHAKTYLDELKRRLENEVVVTDEKVMAMREHVDNSVALYEEEIEDAKEVRDQALSEMVVQLDGKRAEYNSEVRDLDKSLNLKRSTALEELDAIRQLFLEAKAALEDVRETKRSLQQEVARL